MPTSGAPLVIMIAGMAFFAIGFVTIFIVLAVRGGLSRSRTFTAMSKFSPAVWVVFLLALASCACGGLATCGSIAMGDAEVRRACVEDCARAGHTGGRIAAASAPAGPGTRSPPPSCWCTGRAGPVELRPAR